MRRFRLSPPSSGSPRLRAGVRLHSHASLRYLSFPAFDSYPEVSALTTLRNEDIYPAAPSQQTVAAAGHSVAHVLGVPFQNLIMGRQVHGTNIFSFSKSHPAAPRRRRGAEARVVPSTDGFLTNARRMALVVLTADCLPVFLYGRKRSVIGLLHCGRAGTLHDIVGIGIQRMTEDFGASPTDCIAVIGPSIGPCCYDIDLWGANEQRLKELGVSAVFNCRICTKCSNQLFYSYRAERERAGRMISAIALK